jgi:hypothetical protein
MDAVKLQNNGPTTVPMLSKLSFRPIILPWTFCGLSLDKIDRVMIGKNPTKVERRETEMKTRDDDRGATRLIRALTMQPMIIARWRPPNRDRDLFRFDWTTADKMPMERRNPLRRPGLMSNWTRVYSRYACWTPAVAKI